MSDGQRGLAGQWNGRRALYLLLPILIIILLAIIPLRLTTHRKLSLVLSAGGESTGEPAKVEPLAEPGLSRVVLTEQAAERLGIQTAPVREERVVRKRTTGAGEVVALPAAQRKIVPYAAVLYDVHGDTWVYTNPEPLTFVRHRIGVDYIDGDLAVLSEGPPSGTKVVTVGAAELFGTEFGMSEP